MLHPFLITPVYDQGIRLCFPHRKRGHRDAAHLLGWGTDSKEARQGWQASFFFSENAFYFQKHGSVPIHELIRLRSAAQNNPFIHEFLPESRSINPDPCYYLPLKGCLWISNRIEKLDSPRQKANH